MTSRAKLQDRSLRTQKGFAFRFLGMKAVPEVSRVQCITARRSSVSKVHRGSILEDRGGMAVVSSEKSAKAESVGLYILRELLGDWFRVDDESHAVCGGRLFILPSTFVGGARYVRQQMHDIIPMSTKVDYPDILLTVI